MRNLFGTLITLVALALASSATAQQSERFGDYELHYSVVNTTFLSPEVAAAYQITRGDKKAILNLSLRKHTGAGTEPAGMAVEGTHRDYIHNGVLTFQEIRESGAIYYIAPFDFINEEWRFFDIQFQPEGSDARYTFEFKHQLYIN